MDYCLEEAKISTPANIGVFLFFLTANYLTCQNKVLHSTTLDCGAIE